MKEKSKESKVGKGLALVLALVLLAGVLIFTNGLWGNPLSKYLAKRNALAYVEKNYKDEGFELKYVNYNFKVGGYHAYFEIPCSKDYHFSVSTDLKGKVIYEDYENIVDGFNTMMRLDMDYRKLTEEVTNRLESEDSGTFAFGSLVTGDEEAYSMAVQSIPHLKVTLVPDKNYDIYALGKDYGVIVWVIRDDEVTFERAKAYLLELKEQMDQVNIPFAAVDFSLGPKKPTPGEDESIAINAVFYEQIEDTEEFFNLLKDLHTRQMEIYRQADGKK